jgi:hypothetical protein
VQDGPAKNNRGKWILVGVLGVVLAAVVVWQLLSLVKSSKGDAQPEAAARDEEDRPQGTGRTLKPQGAALAPAGQRQPTQWPSIPLAKVIAYDPFAPEGVTKTASGDAASISDLELAAEQERAAQLAETLEALRERGVNMVLHTSSGPVATIGDRMIKVGDKVGDYRVAEIDADGVVLEPAPPK